MGLIFKAKTIKGIVIQRLSEALKELVNDINLIVTRKVETTDNNGKKIVSGGIVAVTFAFSHTVLTHLKLDAQNFDEYEYNYEKDKFPVGINTQLFFKVMKTLDNNDTVTLFVDSENSNELGIRFQNAEKNKDDTKWIPMMDIDEYQIDIKPEKFSTFVTIPSNLFNKTIRDLNSLAKKVTIEQSKKDLYFKTTDSFKSCLKLGEAENGITIFSEDENKEIFEGKYEIKYLFTFTKCTSLCTNVELFLKNDYPLVIKYYVASLGKIYFCLSSKEDSDKMGYSDDEESDDSDSDSD